MKRPDEIALWDSFPVPFEFPRDAAAALGMPPRRLYYLCVKWSNQGIYDYGVSADMGWKVQP